MPTISKTIEIEVEIEYEADPGEPQTWEHPGSPPYMEIQAVRAGLVDVIGSLSDSQLEDLANEISEKDPEEPEPDYDTYMERDMDRELSEEGNV